MSIANKNLIAALALVPAACVVSAQTVELDGIKYELNTSTHEASASYADADLTTAAIRESVEYDGAVYTVSALADRAFFSCRNLQSISIPASVKSIGTFAFLGSSALERVDTPSLADWLDIAFKDGYSNPLVYAHNLYIDGTLLEHLVLPDGLEVVPANAFTGASITTVEFPASVTEVGALAFYECKSLTAFEAGTGLSTIATQAFDGCSAMTTATFAPAVTTVGSYAFNDCSSLTTVTFGTSVSTVGMEAFAGCDALEAVDVADIASWCNIDFAESGANPLAKAHVLRMDGKTVTELDIPAGITTVKDDAFAGCTAIESVVFGADVTSVGDNAFKACPALTTVRFDGPVNSIGNYAFDGCSKLSECALPESLSSIGQYAFCGTALKEVTIPAGVTTLPDAVFSECEDLASVHLPDGLSAIGFGCFSYCTALEEIVLPDKLEKLGKSAFYYCSALRTVRIGEQPSTISDYAFASCPAIADVYVAAAVPPVASDNVFSTYAASLHVPEGSVEAYAADSTWGLFTSIDGISGVEKIDAADYAPCSIIVHGNTVSFTDMDGKVEIVRTDGRTVYSGASATITLAPGIYIIRHGATTTKISIN